jgi:hypothetical protein
VIARYTAAGFRDIKVVDSSVTAGRVELTVERSEAGSLPGPLAKLTSGAVQLRQTDIWEHAADTNERRAQWKVTTRGVPVTLAGAIVIAPMGSGTMLTQSAEVAARIPIMGGKIEGLTIDQTIAKLELEWRWIADHLE